MSSSDRPWTVLLAFMGLLAMPANAAELKQETVDAFERYVRLTEEHRTTLRDRLKQSLPTRADGTIHLIARAWAVSGNNPC